MIKVVGIRFQRAGKIYYFDPLDYDLETAMHVIVETARGVEMGTVLIPPKEVDDDKVVQPLKPVIRIATDDDEKVIEKNKEKEAEAYVICKEKIAKHGLDMKLVAAEYTFDNNKLLFYFTADGRIDFRELVKDLASVFRTRIELRQIGVRDETKMLGGIGICGRELCCRSYLTDFVPVSIKMAKEQNLSLNPTKISGVCGRLMCCLKNEQETYEYLNSRLPLVGDSVITPTGMHGEVSGVNVLRQLVKVVVDNGEEKELQEYAVDDLKFTPRRRRDVRVTDEEMKELEGLEDKEARRKKTNVRSGRTAGKTTVANTAGSGMIHGIKMKRLPENRHRNVWHQRQMPEVKTVKNVSTKTVAITVEETTGIAAKSASTASRMKTVRNVSTKIVAITAEEITTEIVQKITIMEMAAKAEKNVNIAVTETTDDAATTTERIIRVETTNVENKNGVTIHSHERLDELHRNGYWIIQDPGRFCFGMDAVLLSGFAKVKPGERALDLGTGTGIIPILLEAKTKGEHFTGLEIQPESADMAARSVAYNHLEEKITIVTGDIKEASARFGAGSFEVITTNPPYMIGQHGIQNDASAKTIARHEVLCDLDDILRESAKILKQGGRFYMVHRPFRLAEIFSKMVAYHIEPKRIRLVYPFVDKEPNMVLIEGLRGGKSRLTVEKPLIVYKEPGVYMPEIYDIYGY